MTGVGFLATHTVCEGYRGRTNSKKKTKNNLCAETAKMRSEKKGTADKKKPEQQMTFP
jgi:hypothetical protein